MLVEPKVSPVTSHLEGVDHSISVLLPLAPSVVGEGLRQAIRHQLGRHERMGWNPLDLQG